MTPSSPRLPGPIPWLPACLVWAGLAACGREGLAAAPSTGLWPVVLADGAEAQPQYERVVLVTIDTLRADHVSSYGYPRPTTPFLDSLAARGVRFERAMAAVSHTAPSHATMLTGLVPAVHGVLRNGERLETHALDAAQLFRHAGFESAAFLNAMFLSGVAGDFETVVVRGAGGKHPHSGQDVVDAAIAWLGEEPRDGPAPEGTVESRRKGPRFFLWVHLYDAHEWQVRGLARRETATWIEPSSKGLRAHLLAQHGLPPEVPGQPYTIDGEKDHAGEEHGQDWSLAAILRGIDDYDELVRFADSQVERLYGAVEGLGLPGRTLWVVTSDHGEGLASHGTIGHGSEIYQEQLHVPLILHASDGSLGPRVVEPLVGHIDLLPTLAESLGLGVVGTQGLYHGRSLWPLVRGEPGPDARALFAQRRPAESASDEEWADVYVLQTAHHKVILRSPSRAESSAGQEEFFDLVRDPKELAPLEAESDVLSVLRTGLGERLRAYNALGSGGLESIPDEWRKELQGLGYF